MYIVNNQEDIFSAIDQGIVHFDLSRLDYMSWPKLSQTLEACRASYTLYFKLNDTQSAEITVIQGYATNLWLRGGGFENYDFIIHFRYLKKLVIAYPDYVKLHQGYITSSLKELSILGKDDRTTIVDIDFPFELRNLEYLYLSQVKLLHENALAHLNNLQHLEITQCHLADLNQIARLTNLKSLGLYVNDIKDLRPIRHLIEKGIPVVNNNHPIVRGIRKDNEYRIAIAHNPLENPPMEIVIMGNWAIIAYFDGRREFNGVKREWVVRETGTKIEVVVPLEVLARGEDSVNDYLWKVDRLYRNLYFHAESHQFNMLNVARLNS